GNAFVDEVELAPVKVAREKSAEKNGENGDEDLSVQKQRETSLADPLILPIAEDRTVLVPGIPTGLYRLQKVRTNGGTSMFSAHSRYVTVNPDPAESDLALVSGEDLNEIAGESWSRLQVGETLSFAPEGWEAWKWLVLALVVLYAGEGFVGWWLSARREKERAEELPSFNGEGTEV
ncbi:MAG: hypothetical protein KGZ25_06075, partial [Planctomycetes bacterium]|nr:hypothetical protein [Planctomycetota bacterium]